MELAASTEPLKHSSNLSEFISKVAKVCNLRSIGVFSTSVGNLNQGGYNLGLIFNDNGPSLSEDKSSDAAEDPEFDDMKIHMHPTEVWKKWNEYGHMEILKLFDTLLALKLAYVKLQEAHIPYDPEKVRAADEEVVSQLESLCKIKKAYKEKLLMEVNSVSACSALLLAEVHVQERFLQKLKSQAKNKENEVVKLQRELQELEMRNKKLAELIRDQEKMFLKSLNYYSLEDAVKTAGKAIHDFAKPLIALMKVSDWNLDQAADAIQESVVYTKRSHKKYTFEAYIARRMFHLFSAQPCILENIMKLDDPIDALIQDPQSNFAKFCRKKYLLVVHPQMEASFFGNLDHRTFVTNGIHPYTLFYRAFVKMAKWIWFLQGFTAFIKPKAQIYGVKQGSDFSDVYMEVVDEVKDYKAVLDKGQERCKVEFMVMPGFKQGEHLIRSQVYISKVGISNGTYYEERF